MFKGLFNKRDYTTAKVTVTYEVDYNGHISHSDIDYTDLIKDANNIKKFGKVSLRRCVELS